MGYAEHQQRVEQEGPRALPCAVITVSDSRTVETDSSGQLIQTQLSSDGHTVVHYAILKDEAAQITALVEQLAAEGTAKVVILNGGTGIGKRDSTFEAIDALLEKRLPGFGELFRLLSYQEIGPAAMLSRATAGTYKGLLIFSTPGSPHAVELALGKLIIPELRHLAWETVRA